MTDVVSQLHPKDTWLRRFVAALLVNVRTRRPVCPVCWIPFSDWFVWGCWSYCYPCHDATGYVILEPYGRAAAFRATQEQETKKVSKFRKKPVVIEAHQFGGTVSSADAIIAWAGMEPRPNEQELDYSVSDHSGTFRDRIERPEQFGPLVIHTLEGDMTAQEGDWIIRGVKGEFYPCKPDIFAATYEPVND